MKCDRCNRKPVVSYQGGLVRYSIGPNHEYTFEEHIADERDEHYCSTHDPRYK